MFKIKDELIQLRLAFDLWFMIKDKGIGILQLWEEGERESLNLNVAVAHRKGSPAISTLCTLKVVKTTHNFSPFRVFNTLRGEKNTLLRSTGKFYVCYFMLKSVILCSFLFTSTLGSKSG